jgi:outer membrane protein assembly factor BamA
MVFVLLLLLLLTEVNTQSYNFSKIDAFSPIYLKMRSLLTVFILCLISFRGWTQKVNLSLGTDSIPNEISFQDQQGRIHILNSVELQKLLADSLGWYLNNGYPFAEIHAHISSGVVPCLTVVSIRGPLVNFGALRLKPDGIMHPKTAERLLQIQTGAPFSQAQLEQLDVQIAGNLPFKLKRAPEWDYKHDQAEIFLYLERTKLSSASGILGLQQNASTNKNTIVGELNVQLQNAWQKNEKFNLHWRSIAPQTQQLKTSLLWPYIAGTSYGLATGFSLYKRDTTFLEVKGNLAITYLFANNWQFLTQIEFWRSSRLSTLTPIALQNFQLFSYGIGLQRQKIDFMPNPRKGMEAKVLYSVGNKQALTQALTWRLELMHRYYANLNKRQVICFTQQLEHVSSQSLLNNELYRFGGLQRMRGFDEDAFFASSIAYAGLEYRFLLDQYAHFLVFTDWAWLNNQAAAQAKTIYSVGFGLAMGNENGQFKLSYGLGTQIGQGLQLNAGKLHVGYISYF